MVKESIPNLKVKITEMPAPNSTSYQLYSNAKMDIFDLCKNLNQPTDPALGIKNYLTDLSRIF
jgi:hypothetical protein